VDAAGQRLRVTADENADLFWALRGGGGDFAIVVATEVALHAESDLFGGGITWPQPKAAEVLTAFREVTADAPEELTVWATLLDVPGGGPKLVLVNAVFLGPESEGRQLLKPFEAVDGAVGNTLAALRMTDLAKVTEDPTDPGPSNGRTELLSRFGAAEQAALLAEPVGPLTFIQVRHLGGALTRPHDGPHGTIDEPYAVALFGIPLSPDQDPPIVAKQNAVIVALGDAVVGRKPFTFLGQGETAADAFRPEELGRLREIKAERDPNGVIRSNYPVLD
jgi:FAD/FMN-containing dehydrogenase